MHYHPQASSPLPSLLALVFSGHMPDMIAKKSVHGNITWATDKSIEETVCGLRTALGVIDDQHKIIIPPIPRYMFGGCCADGSHAPNTKDLDHAKDTLTDHIRIRNKLKQCIITKGKSNTRILDVISALAGEQQAPTERIKALRTHTHPDNVHLTTQGYQLIAKAITSTTFTPPQTASNTPQHCTSPATKNWRGFLTTAGVGRTSTPVSAGRAALRHYPYRR